MNSLEYIKARDAHHVVDYVRNYYNLAAPDAPLHEQIRALGKRQCALIKLWTDNKLVQAVFPSGFWEEDNAIWCFCAAAPAGHELESTWAPSHYGLDKYTGCLFRDGELFDKLCPACRQPCETYVVTEVGGERDERWRSARTKCCGETPVRPNGTRVTASECDFAGDDE